MYVLIIPIIRLFILSHIEIKKNGNVSRTFPSRSVCSGSGLRSDFFLCVCVRQNMSDVNWLHVIFGKIHLNFLIVKIKPFMVCWFAEIWHPFPETRDYHFTSHYKATWRRSINCFVKKFYSHDPLLLRTPDLGLTNKQINKQTDGRTDSLSVQKDLQDPVPPSVMHCTVTHKRSAPQNG